jgi:hypothetical protein
LVQTRRHARQARAAQPGEIQKEREQRAAREQEFGQHIRAETPRHLRDGAGNSL